MVDAAIRLQREGDEGVFHVAVAEVGFEGVVLPVLQVGNPLRSVIEGEDELATFVANRDRAVPGIGVNAGIFFLRQGRFAVGVAAGVLFFRDFGGCLFLLVVGGFEGSNPIRGLQREIVIENVKQDGIESAALLGIGQNDDTEIFFRDEHDTRNEAGHPAGVPNELAAVIIAETPAEAIRSKSAAERSQGAVAFASRKQRLRRPHLAGLLFAEKAALAVGKFAAIQL